PYHSDSTHIYTSHYSPLSLHDALPICLPRLSSMPSGMREIEEARIPAILLRSTGSSPSSDPPRSVMTEGVSPAIMPSYMRSNIRSEEHTSELQSLRHIVCRLLLEKKKK